MDSGGPARLAAIIAFIHRYTSATRQLYWPTSTLPLHCSSSTITSRTSPSNLALSTWRSRCAGPCFEGEAGVGKTEIAKVSSLRSAAR
jgi:hypothetical protein